MFYSLFWLVPSILVLIVQYAGKSWDYENYENAARAVILHTNPYKSGHSLYPPLLAQTLAYIYTMGERLLDTSKINPWLVVFYVYQCAQFFGVNLAYQLSGRFASRVGLSGLHGKLIVAGLFLFNFPLIRTLTLNQVNPFILLMILTALLALDRYPVLSGIAVMLGGLVKLYPMMMGVPLLLMKKWRAVLGALVGGAVIVLIQTNLGRDLILWKQYLQFFISFPAERESSIWIRNTTFLSLARNLTRFTTLPETLITPLYITSALAVMIWVFIRFYQREKNYMLLKHNSGEYRVFGNLLDFANLALLVTPSAWDHHYVIALPLALWAIALRGKDQPGWVGMAIICIFVLPPLDIFPFSYLRMLGIIVLLILTSPNAASNLTTGAEIQPGFSEHTI